MSTGDVLFLTTEEIEEIRAQLPAPKAGAVHEVALWSRQAPPNFSHEFDQTPAIPIPKIVVHARPWKNGHRWHIPHRGEVVL